MAWVRIHDGALSHPKLVGLIDWKNPFCVWVWGLSYCQTHLTDGLIPRAAVPNPIALRTAGKLLAAGVWEQEATHGFRVHDYLDWNDGREVITQKRLEAKERMKNARARTHKEVRENFYVDSGVSSGSSSEKKRVRAADRGDLGERAARLLDSYARWYSQYRNGAKTLLLRNSLQFDEAMQLVEAWDDARLEKLAQIILTTDDEFVVGTDRSFHIFRIKASWADDRLSGVEHAVKVGR